MKEKADQARETSLAGITADSRSDSCLVFSSPVFWVFCHLESCTRSREITARYERGGPFSTVRAPFVPKSVRRMDFFAHSRQRLCGRLLDVAVPARAAPAAVVCGELAEAGC